MPRKFGERRPHVNETSGDQLPFSVELTYQMILRNVFRAIISDVFRPPLVEVWKKLVRETEKHPKLASKIIRLVVELTPAEIPPEYINQIVEAVIKGRTIVMLGPHWSVIDIGVFLRVMFEVNQHSKMKNQGRQLRIIGPASSKFYDYRMVATALISALERLGLTLVQVAQVQDEELRESSGQASADAINIQAWRQILPFLKLNDTALCAFPEGTRAGIGEGTKSAPSLVLKALNRFIPKNALIVPVATPESDLSLGKGMAMLDVAHWPTMYVEQPVDWSDCQRLGPVLGCNPVDVARVIALARHDKSKWGVLSDSIKLYQQLLTEYGSIKQLLLHRKQRSFEYSNKMGLNRFT